MRRRITICLGLLLGLFVIGDVIALLCLNRSIIELTALAESHRIQVMRANLASSAVRIETDLIAYAAGRPRDALRQRDSVRRFRAAMHACGDCHHGPAVQAQLDEVHETFHAYAAAVDRLLDSVDTEDAHALERDANLIADRLTREATHMADRAMDHVSVGSEDAAGSVRNAWVTLIGTLVATLAVGGILARHLQRRLTRPVDALMRGIRLIRDGQTRHRFEIDGDEEFRALGSALNSAYESMLTAQEGVLQAEKMAALGKLAAGIAHEVGNPLASISSVAQLMQRHNAAPEQTERIDLIRQHVARASQIVRELLAFSRPSRDDRLGPVDVSALLDKAISLLKYDKRAGHSAVDPRYEPNLCIKRGNADRLLLVFTNVMINAFDAIAARRDGDGRLTVAAGREGERIVVRFEDNGSGMSEEQIESAFEPFFTTKEPGAGTGLGLWVCYQIVERQGGIIRIDSRAGAGTTITIELPIDRPPLPTASTDQVTS